MIMMWLYPQTQCNTMIMSLYPQTQCNSVIMMSLYSQTQCKTLIKQAAGTGGGCFCVDRHGNRIAGTSAATKSKTNCDGKQYRTNCECDLWGRTERTVRVIAGRAGRTVRVIAGRAGRTVSVITEGGRDEL